ncbi:hypothetical protein OSW16_06255 [Pseudomonas putida]|uniref:hypothetical protein n=1 Tax=Pseudomonas putida TaxID=303 RepID=UPI002270F069|nr:hypothetical protein [Pseudomonas putida]WAB99252.1 hypothetical protein OSW16_06255 [Pseudomonas putida]
MKRRDLLKIGLAGGVVAGLNVKAIAAGLGSLAPSVPELVIVDERFEASRRFGMEAARRGLPHHLIDGDITDLWFSQLDPQWRQKPSIIAGMTARQPLFCLERLALDRGMRVVLRITHEATENNHVAHHIEANNHLHHPLSELLQGADWSERMAGVAGTCSWARTNHGCQPHRTFSTAAEPSLLNGPLVSWVIAPLVA